MDNVCPEGTQYQYISYTSGEVWGRNANLRYSECNRKHPQTFDPRFGYRIYQNSDATASLVYIIKYCIHDSNVYIYEILYLSADWDAENCTDTPL